jgi:hypothetical protein
MRSLPQLDPTKPAEAKEGVVTFVRSLSGALDDVKKAMQDAGAPPVEDAEETYEETMADLGASMEGLTEVADQLEETEVKDQEAFESAMAAAKEKMAEVGVNTGPIKQLRDNPALEAAFGEAETCQQISA